MSKDEAIKEMQKGNKVTHEHFSSNEWMTIRSKKIVFEDGVKCYPETFFAFRTDSSWDNGYSLFEN